MRSIDTLRNLLDRLVRIHKNQPGDKPGVGASYDAVEALDRMTGKYSQPPIPPKATMTFFTPVRATDVVLQRVNDYVLIIVSEPSGKRTDLIIPDCDWDALRLHILG